MVGIGQALNSWRFSEENEVGDKYRFLMFRELLFFFYIDDQVVGINGNSESFFYDSSWVIN